MALHDEIMKEIILGTIPARFCVQDLKKNKVAGRDGYYRVGDGEYAENSLNVIPANHSISRDERSQGDYVVKGRAPAFYRLGNGQYEVIADRTHDIDDIGLEVGEEGDGEELIGSVKTAVSDECGNIQELERGYRLHHNERCADDPVGIIVRYIESTPYQRLFRRQRRHLPDAPVQGWERRLGAYFWPRIEDNWDRNNARFNDFCERFQGINNALMHDGENAAQELLDLFRDICIWGNVRLPENDPLVLTKQVINTLGCLDNNEIPESPLNSAWTKLYAVTRPESSVIYDSRVAAAITSILDPCMSVVTTNGTFDPYEGLGYVNGRGGSRPRALRWEWNNGYQRWSSQCAASKLCREIMQRLNENTNKETPWTLREVEAVLFMEGY